MERFSRKPNMSPSHQFPTSACRRVWALLRALELSLATKTNTRAWHVWHVGIHGILNHLPSWIQRIDFLWFLYLAPGGTGTTWRMLVFCIKNYQIPPARVSTHQSRLRSTDSHAANTSALAKAAKVVMLHSANPPQLPLYCTSLAHRLSP